MSRVQTGFFAALALSLVLHASLLAPWPRIAPTPVLPDLRVEFVAPPAAVETPPPPPKRLKTPPSQPSPAAPLPAQPAAAPRQAPAFLAAPAAPSAEEWRLASGYTLKNSKRYRNAWGQQVRSMMGSAVAGPDQGQVRFRIEIAPNGQIQHVEELWSTSAVASKLAWQAIRAMPPLPPTPTGKPLIFEQTISFLPYETGWPPSYKLDCLPDPPVFKNPYAWDGASPPPAGPPKAAAVPAEAAATDCPSDSTADSIEEEERELNRQMEQNRWGR